MITLIIPTMNRSDFLIRLLYYYRNLGFQGCIRIGDSSTGEHLKRAKLAIEALKGQLDIVHIEYPGLNNAECVRNLLETVSTKYATVLPDDDFLIPQSLHRCVHFLETNPDYIAAHGVAAIFSIELAGAHGVLQGVRPYSLRAIDGEAGRDRIFDHLSNYSVTLFAVHRIEEFRTMYQNVSLLADKPFALELFPGCLSVILGKIKKLDCLYMVRQDHDRRYPLPGVFEWITGSDWLPSCKVFCDYLTNELAQQDSITIEEAQRVVQRSLCSYLAQSLRKSEQKLYYGNGGKFLSYRQRLARQIPILRSTYHRLRSFLPGETKRISLPALLWPTSPYHRDFMPVYQAVTQNLTSPDPTYTHETLNHS